MTLRPGRRLLTPAAVLLALFATAVPFANAAAPQASLPDIEDEVMCAVCGTPLNASGGPQADRERAYIQGLIDQGKSKPQIKDALVTQYGRRVLALPDSKGANLAVYLVPIALVAAALAALAVWLPRWRRRGGGGGGDTAGRGPDGGSRTGTGISAADARRLDEDLARYEL